MDWFRMYGEFATDPKVQMLPEAMQRRLVMLMCLQCSNGIETFHETERESSIAFALRISEAEMAETKDLFLRKGFIREDWTLANWEKRQYASDSSTARVRRHREKSKQASETHETFQKRSGNGLEQNRTDTEQIKDNPPTPRKRGKSNSTPALTVVDLQARGVPQDVATEFLALRSRKRAPLTEIALAGIQREADKAGLPLGEALRKCVERGWQGFDAAWVQNQSRASPAATRNQEFMSKIFDDGPRAVRDMGVIDASTGQFVCSPS
ncbi:hypothetical protein [Bordetella hinzii]|uniref:hypothetical protein n=1 Tax=Bordetella hinzii TaxID=103855 RepID=UPI00114FA96F|nr:hypothetical protein [Bordetella hinzii]QDJ44990.1 hypothetical protein CBR71_03775 [Bordetella hinzii]